MLNEYEIFFDELCNNYYKKILKYLMFNLNDESCAMDAVQDVFLIAYEKIKSLKSHPNPAGFLFQTAKNIMKKKKREIYQKVLNEVYKNDNSIIDIADNNSNIINILDKNINEDDFLIDVFSQLSKEKKELYSLYYIQNNSMENIALKLGIEYSALRMRYVRLRKEIKEIVNKISEEKFIY